MWKRFNKTYISEIEETVVEKFFIPTDSGENLLAWLSKLLKTWKFSPLPLSLRNDLSNNLNGAECSLWLFELYYKTINIPWKWNFSYAKCSIDSQMSGWKG